MNFFEKINTNWKTTAAVLAILFLAAAVLIYFAQKNGPAGQNPPLGPQTGSVEVYSLAASILSIDVQNRFITVKHPVDGQEVKVVLNGNSEILKLEFPFDPANPPKSGTFTAKAKKITLNDLKPGSQALIESRDNIYQKTEFDSVKRIQVLP